MHILDENSNTKSNTNSNPNPRKESISSSRNESLDDPFGEIVQQDSLSLSPDELQDIPSPLHDEYDEIPPIDQLSLDELDRSLKESPVVVVKEEEIQSLQSPEYRNDSFQESVQESIQESVQEFIQEQEEQTEQKKEEKEWTLHYTDDNIPYYYNEKTEFSLWKEEYDKLHGDITPRIESLDVYNPQENPQGTSQENSQELLNESKDELQGKDEEWMEISGTDARLNQIDFIPPQFIKKQGLLMWKKFKLKDKKHSWHTHWAILVVGLLFFYKEDPSEKSEKKKRKPSLVIPLESLKIQSASKEQTKKKNAIELYSELLDLYWILFPIDEHDSSWSECIQDSCRERCSDMEYVSALQSLIGTSCSTLSLSNPSFNPSPNPHSNSNSNTNTNSNTNPSHTVNAVKKQVKDKMNHVLSHLFTPKKGKFEPLFGGSLSSQYKPDHPIPIVIEICIQAIDTYGLTSQGIYRLSGNSNLIQKFKVSFNQRILFFILYNV